jgi:hypothetical protein
VSAPSDFESHFYFSRMLAPPPRFPPFPTPRPRRRPH